MRVAVPGDATAGPQVEPVGVGGGGADGQAEVEAVGADPAEGAHGGPRPTGSRVAIGVQRGEFGGAGDGAAGADGVQQVGEAGAAVVVRLRRSIRPATGRTSGGCRTVRPPGPIRSGPPGRGRCGPGRRS